MLLKLCRRLLVNAGYKVTKASAGPLHADMFTDKQFMELYELCKPYSMTSIERLYSLYQAVNYIIDHHIKGDLVECGVWRGGSAMMMALALKQRNEDNRLIYLYDTFEGMSEPTKDDKSFQGDRADELLNKQDKADANSIWCFSSIEEVKENLQRTNYPESNLRFVKGKVEDTLQNVKPGQIALLRLDTDWYISTKAELNTLYPLLNPGGILIIDDFGHWEGAKKAVLEYFEESKPFLHRIDNTGRMLIKNN